MATPVIMPRQGQSVESCVIGKWHKQKGDKVSVGDILFTYETDKATFEEESKTEGIILDVFFEEGDDVECLTTVCVIGDLGESVEEFRPGGAASAADEPSAQAEQGDSETGDDSPVDSELQAVSSETGLSTIHISPRARQLAEKTGADINRAIPTGANSRIMEADIQKVIADGHFATRAVDVDFTNIQGTGIGGRITTHDAGKQAVAPAYQAQADLPSARLAVPISPDSQDVKLTNIRKVIARAMHASLSGTAQLTHHSSFDATDVLNFRKNLKAIQESRKQGNGSSASQNDADGQAPRFPKITITDIMVYAVSRVLLRHKSINAHFLDDKMTIFNNAHVGVAVDTPRGLLVPTIFNANCLSLSELSAHAKAMFEKCKQGTIEPDVLKGASFTISNLGALGVEMFTPVLNPPQTGLLGVCCVVERTKNGRAYPAMGLSLTYDHRALDGADAARFHMDLVDYLERFTANLALDG